jgi:uncharacterized OB-fold protein
VSVETTRCRECSAVVLTTTVDCGRCGAAVSSRTTIQDQLAAESVAIMHVNFERLRDGRQLLAQDGALARVVIREDSDLAALDLVPGLVRGESWRRYETSTPPQYFVD